MDNYYIPERNFCIKSINTAFKKYCSSDFIFKGEAHNFWELLFVKEGVITVVENDKVYTLSKGKIIFHKPMDFHKFWVTSNSGAEIIVISFSAEGNMIDGLGEGYFELNHDFQKNLVSLITDINNGYANAMYATSKKIVDNNPLEELLPLVKLETFLLSVLSKATLDIEQQHNQDAFYYQQIIDVMNKHLYKRLSVSQLASLCCMSVSNLKRVFKSHIEGGVMGYFTKLKILRAMELLKDGMSVVEVSELLSFSSPNYFSAVFQRETGMLPSQYRKNPHDNPITLKLI